MNEIIKNQRNFFSEKNLVSREGFGKRVKLYPWHSYIFIFQFWFAQRNSKFKSPTLASPPLNSTFRPCEISGSRIIKHGWRHFGWLIGLREASSLPRENRPPSRSRPYVPGRNRTRDDVAAICVFRRHNCPGKSELGSVSFPNGRHRARAYNIIFRSETRVLRRVAPAKNRLLISIYIWHDPRARILVLRKHHNPTVRIVLA